MIQPIKCIVLNKDGSLTEHSRTIVLNKINEIISVLNDMNNSEVSEEIKPKIKEIRVIFND